MVVVFLVRLVVLEGQRSNNFFSVVATLDNNKTFFSEKIIVCMATATIPPEPSALNIAVSDTCEGWFRLATKEVADAYVCKDLLNIKEDPNATNFILVPNM
jgi:hypothetical protein